MSVHKDLTQLPLHKTDGLLTSYVVGFALSIGLTLLAYYAVVHHWYAHSPLIVFLLTLAISQFAGQLFFFLHIGRETRPRWKLFMLFLAIVVVMIVVLGSIWIMYNLNYRMTPHQVEQYLQKQDGGI